MSGNSIPPDYRLGQGRHQRGIGHCDAKDSDDGSRDPEKRTQPARSKDGTDDSGGSVEREIGCSKKLLDTKYVRRDGDEGAKDCSGRGVARYSAPSRRFAKGNP